MNTLYSYIYNDDKKGIDSLSDNTLIQIINDLREIGIDIDFPKICVVGTQSSGKSSLLNSIINRNILPVGKNMVTRTPLDIRLLKIKNVEEEKIEIGEHIFSKENYYKIEKVIENITDEYAGCEKAISDKPIIIKIYNKHLHNLSFIDLPGMTMVACRDKGQPADIKQQIRELIGKYIEQENTIILAVMTARSDLEADIGMDMIKEYDVEGKRTLGIITKVDLLNDGDDIKKYLENNEEVSKDLQLFYGYHAIMNKSNYNGNLVNINNWNNNGDEEKYFKNSKIYSQMNKSCYGIGELTNKIRDILIDKIKKNIPNIKEKLNILEIDIKSKLGKIGKPLPVNINEKKTFIQSKIIKINGIINSALNEKGFEINIGVQIKNEFIKFRKEISKNNYNNNNNNNILKNKFENENFSSIQSAIKNCEGNHMSYSISPIEILEYCVKNDKLIRKLSPYCLDCVSNIKLLLYKLILEILKDIKRFPKFYEYLKNELINKINISIKTTISKINEIIEMEENYIWTDDKNFIDELQGNTDNSDKKYDKLISMYLNTVIGVLQNNVPKCIMYNMISNLNLKMDDIDNVVEIEEKREVGEKRIEYTKILEIIEKAKTIL